MREIIRTILFAGATLVGILWCIYGVPLYGILPPITVGMFDMVILWTILYGVGLLPDWITGEKDDDP